MKIFFYSLSGLLIVLSILPMFPLKHWMFRVWEFAKIQILVLFILVSAIAAIFIEDHTAWFYTILGLNIAFIVFHLYLLIPFSPVYRWFRPIKKITENLSAPISVLSANVYQDNQEHDKFIGLINNVKPDIFLTLETDHKWEAAMAPLEKTYPYNIKVALDNTYGMHLYSKIKFKKGDVHYLVSDDIPSIEAHFDIEDGFSVIFYGVHPPPPSPTEEETSKERDGEMMALAKKIKESDNKNVVVIGDFNNVAWAKSSRRFRKISGLIDPRFGRGLISTFHAKYPLLRIPIDLMFHGECILIDEFKRSGDIASDHFPIYTVFRISKTIVQKSDEKPEADDITQMEKDIQEGKEEQGDR